MLKGTQRGIKALTAVRERRPPGKTVDFLLSVNCVFPLLFFPSLPLEGLLEDGLMSGAESSLASRSSDGGHLKAGGGGFFMLAR